MSHKTWPDFRFNPQSDRIIAPQFERPRRRTQAALPVAKGEAFLAIELGCQFWALIR
jgi:hypothetical protein